MGDTYGASAVARFEEINMMKVESINNYQIGIFVGLYKYMSGKLPIACKDFVVRVEDSHGYSTRATGGMVRQYARKNYRQYAVACKGPKIWNDIHVPTVMKSANALHLLYVTCVVMLFS